jgi:hypothetical protein
MNKSLGFVTETVDSFYGRTLFSFPQKDLRDVVASSQNRALVRCPESIVIQWTSQPKTQVPFKFDAITSLAERAIGHYSANIKLGCLLEGR